MGNQTRVERRAAVVAALLAMTACYGGGGQAADTEASRDPQTGAGESLARASTGVALSDDEVAEGWRLLFNGADLDGWRGYGLDRIPEGWSAVDGTLHFTPGLEGGDLLTVERFTDFDLRLEWKLESGGNSGVFFHVVEDYGNAYESGPEMQVLDNVGHPDGRDPLTSNGSNFALHAPQFPILRPVGQWNEIRVRVRGPRVEQWLNGGKVVEYDLWTDEWEALVGASKFADMPGYGRAREGHIDLQEHGDPVWYRNIRIRVLD